MSYQITMIASLLNLGGPDMMIVLLIVLLMFGSKKLPELARGMGRAVKEFTSAREDIERELTKSGSSPAMRGELPDTKKMSHSDEEQPHQ
jgi:sec-independent protein translocase protein TatA